MTDLAALSEEFFQLKHSTDPFSATLLGVSDFDDLAPDPSRVGSATTAARFADLERKLAEIPTGGLAESDRINHAVLGRLSRATRSDLEHGLWEAAVSADGYAAPQSMMFMAVPTAPLRDAADVARYQRRLAALPEFLDALLARYRAAAANGRPSTRAGVGQALDQLDGHLAAGLATFRNVRLPAGADGTRIAALITDGVVPALRRLRTGIERDVLPSARDDDRVGIRFVDGGQDGYRAAVRRHTTTDLTPDEIHQIGLDLLADLRDEWAELGRKVLGTSDVPEVLTRLREDPALRFRTSGQIVAVVTEALRRAEAARDDWFPPYPIADCVIEEIDPIEAGNAALAHYRPPADDGSRPGAHCVLTTKPEQRYVYEYEALAFHESTPGHHLQIASAQTLTELPRYRRFLDAEVCGYVEGWGLYCERLADEMGLYTSDLARLGMLSFDALRACRLVVDTGMHHLGWSRQQARRFMWDNTATTWANVRNEIDRYISWPGQALAYAVGRREIRRLRALAEQRLGAGFDIRAFHGTVLGHAAVPLDVLDDIVNRWLDSTA
ncbi:MAG TPA: DUF885 domain-containing protein [Pseudonocardiaceae bacterium]|nr:DUF885 domain-containing protein [Pseudonocardiaceae bacterium]